MKPAKCNLCNNRKFKVRYSSRDYRFATHDKWYKIIKCTNCGLVTQFPKPSKELISLMYPKNLFWGDLTKNRARRVTFISTITKLKYLFYNYQRLTITRPYLRRGASLLDVGCGNGIYLSSMKDFHINLFPFYRK